MRIIFLLSNTELGGAEKQAIVLAKGLREVYSYEIFFICHGDKEGAATNFLSSNSIDYVFFKFYYENSKFRTIKGLFKLINTINRQKANAVMPYVSLANFYCTLIWKFTNTHFCIWNQRDEGLGLRQSLYSRLIIKSASYYISNSINGKDFLIKNFAIDPGKISVIYNGIDVTCPQFNKLDWREINGFLENDILVCMLANITKHKDHITLIKAWKLLQEDSFWTNNLKLIIAGRKEEAYPEVYKYVNDLPHPNSVFFFDYVSDTQSLLNSIDISLLTSLSEGFSNTVLESMASGKVVLGSNINGIREPLSSENKPYLTEVSDHIGLYKSLKFFIENPNLRDEIGILNKHRIQKQFSNIRVFEKTHALLNKLEFEYKD